MPLGRIGCAAVLLLMAVALDARAQPAGVPRADPSRLEARIRELGRFGANPEGGVSRVAFSAADVAGREYVTSLMKAAGLAFASTRPGTSWGGARVVSRGGR